LVRLYARANRVRAPSSRPEVDLIFSPTLPVQKTSLRAPLERFKLRSLIGRKHKICKQNSCRHFENILKIKQIFFAHELDLYRSLSFAYRIRIDSANTFCHQESSDERRHLLTSLLYRAPRPRRCVAWKERKAGDIYRHYSKYTQLHIKSQL